MAVIGSGPAGCALAIRLRRAGVRTAMFGPATGPRNHDIPETVPPGFCESALWTASKKSLRPHYAMASAWGSSELTVRHSIANPVGHGWLVDRAALDSEMAAQAGPQIPGRISSVSGTPTGWLLRFTGGEEVRARVVVDASGRSSAFAKRIGIGRSVFDNLVAVSARGVPEAFPAGEALVESSENGWWFSALSPDGDLSVSFFTYSNIFRQINPAVFAETMRGAPHTAARVSRLPEGPLRSRSARTDALEQPAGKGWIAIGDAAFASDPLGSQGLVRAFEGAEKAASIIVTDATYSPEILREFCSDLDESVVRFLRSRHLFYGMERRWPEAPFWKSVRQRSFTR